MERASLIFFEFRSNASVFRESSMLWRANARTKMFTFVRGRSCRDIPSSIHSELGARLEVYYLLVDADLICRSLPLTKEMLEYRRTDPMEFLFADRTRQLNGYRINCVLMGRFNFLYLPINGKGIGPSLSWLRVTAMMVNATFDFIFGSCLALDDDCWKKYICRKGGFNDIILDTFSIQELDAITMPRLDVSSFVILTPRGAHFGVEELLVAPFSLAVWIVLILFVVTLKFVETYFSTFFRNDLILLPLCGLERQNFLKTSRIERITLTALIIFFFIILSVYEVKIMTLMTNRPRHADVKSIEDLSRKGIKVWCPPHKLSPGDEKNLNLDFESMDNESKTLDGIHTYLFDEQSALLFEHMCGGNTELYSLYIILGEKLRMFIIGNVIFNPTLMEPFRLTHESLIESGIHRFLREGLISHTVGGLHTYKSYQQKQQVTSMLNIEDLLPAWLVLGVGNGIGFCVFLLEKLTICSAKFIQMKLRGRAYN